MSSVPENKLPIELRSNSFELVEKGYTLQEAMDEASRCLQCKKPRCVEGCPLHNDIPTFIKLLKEQNIDEANKVLNKTSSFSNICSYVCYSENQCMKSCIKGIKDKPINIRMLERFISDNSSSTLHKPSFSQIRIAVIGGGPSALAFSKVCLENNIAVDIYDRHKHLGGLLRYGIPRFRLPLENVEKQEEELLSLGLKYYSKDVTSVQDIPGYNYYYYAIGTSQSKKLNIDGEESPKCIDWMEFLEKPHLYKHLKSKNICIIGGGNVAIDVARTAIRLNANATIIYRRTKNEMPCNQKELNEAIDEGLKVIELHNPYKIIDDGQLTIHTKVMILGEMDESGRRIPLETNKTQKYNFDYLIKAIGSNVEPLKDNVVVDKYGQIIVNEQFQTSNDKVYAIGDCVDGASTVVQAIHSGKKAAEIFLKNVGMI